MTIKIPTHTDWNGEGRKPIAGAMERLLKESATQAQPVQPVKYQKSKEGFIYVPSANIQIAKQRTPGGKNWYDTHGELQAQGLRMPTIYEFTEFLKYLKDNPNGVSDASRQEVASILDDILTVRDPWRSEWLDAKFEKKGKQMLVHYRHQVKKDKLEPDYSEPLEECLMKDRQPGINLDAWLNDKTKHGLPKSNVGNGDLWYWFPRDGAVARFRAGSVRASLCCGWNPDYSAPSLGVRAIRRDAPKAQAQKT